MSFQTTWFLLIAVLWIGYFILEGFDFGVGALLTFVSRNEDDRRAVPAGRAADHRQAGQANRGVRVRQHGGE